MSDREEETALVGEVEQLQAQPANDVNAGEGEGEEQGEPEGQGEGDNTVFLTQGADEEEKLGQPSELKPEDDIAEPLSTAENIVTEPEDELSERVISQRDEEIVRMKQAEDRVKELERQLLQKDQAEQRIANLEAALHKKQQAENEKEIRMRELEAKLEKKDDEIESLSSAFHQLNVRLRSIEKKPNPHKVGLNRNIRAFDVKGDTRTKEQITKDLGKHI